MKYAKDEFDRLMEISPDIPDEIILEFKDKFCKNDADPQKILENKYKEHDSIPKNEVMELVDMKKVKSTFNKPDICDNLAEIIVYTKTEEDRGKDATDEYKEKYIRQFKSGRGREPSEEELAAGLSMMKT
jgi:hypothetical protein